jgi:hypothetical protein
MSLQDFINNIVKMRDEAAAKVNRLKDADGDDEFSELNYYHGQKVALDQCLSWYKAIENGNLKN